MSIVCVIKDFWIWINLIKNLLSLAESNSKFVKIEEGIKVRHLKILYYGLTMKNDTSMIRCAIHH